MIQAVRKAVTVTMLVLLFVAAGASAATSEASAIEKAKAAAYAAAFDAPGADPLELSGGPDDYGYIFKDETDSGGPAYDWIDTVGATSLDITGDDTFTVVALPFTFSFYGADFDYCHPSTNGQMGLGSGIRAYANSELPTTNLPASHLCPYWDDLYVDTSSKVLYKTVGTAPNRQFAVIWDSVRTLSSSYRLVFEAILGESDNSITYQYRYLDTNAQGQSATIGEQQAQTGNRYLQYSYNTASLTAGRAIKFWRPEMTADVGTHRIVAPNGVHLMDTIQPEAVIKNYGTAAQSNFGVRLDIGTGYTSTVNVPGPVAPGDTVVVNTFTPWVPTAMGPYAVACSTQLSGDLFERNDKATASAMIVSLVEHFEPTNGGYVPTPDSGHWAWREPAYPRPAPPSSPNVWTIPDSGAYQTYESSYVASCKYVATLDSPQVMFDHRLYVEPNFDGGNVSYSTDHGSTWTVIFPDGTRPYDSLRSGQWGYTGTVPWELATFRVPVLQDSGFKLRWKFMTDLSVQYQGGWMIDDFAGIGIARLAADVGVVQTLAPAESVYFGDTIAPRAVVQNFGSAEQTFVVRFSVGDGYGDSDSMTLAPGLTDTVEFADWTPESLGTFSVTCSTELAGDMDQANDAVHGSATVMPFVGVAEQPRLARAFSLDNALPNPFTGSTTIRFGVTRREQVCVSVYSAAGTLVRTLCNSDLVPGYHSLAWDGRDARGHAAGAGVYLMRMKTDVFTATRKLVLQR
ncbi:hypothetical protein FJY68_01295 [candidate division WOR-3 bacterium]|uniref:FlgD/Vpr Ig-like domain-containing protein n=1 Tax=candidate division WOR-3 bacterium TaxID=2052148 RepID=A0A937XBQ9_UNCW3|nr:hypothetical protein [candidate division WOR-3 bacterium]